MAADALKPSRLLRGLQARLTSARSPIEADCLLAERAVYLARLGAQVRADRIVRELRLRYDRRPQVAIAVWVNLCEGIASHFDGLGPAAADKIRRAHALAEAAGLGQLRALTAAWSAHMAYLDASFESMATFLVQALDGAEPDHHGARSRACLVAAQAFHVAGRFDLAQPWYEATRRHALADGDDATLGALLHNSSWLRATNLRHDVLLRGLPLPQGEQTLLSAESARNFDRFVGATGLPALTPLLRAQILSVQGRAAEAIELYDAHLDCAIENGIGRTIGADLLADRAWCHAELGNLDAARRDVGAAVLRLDSAGHWVDRVVAHKRLAQIYVRFGDHAAGSEQEALAQVAWAGHQAEQARILRVLGGAFPGPLSTH